MADAPLSAGRVGMMRSLKALIADIRGATAVEYGLLAALISVGIIAGVGTFGNNLQNTFTSVSNTLASHSQ
ncbi:MULTISPECIES: Flp family type IVb pilin [unclassified Rhizobium]|uniref:Flp family type IVb pilin n=1 Tax=Rhizobium sp. BG4 TaxID=2613770 RepID=UPI0032B26A39